jgi:hypothetical protein
VRRFIHQQYDKPTGAIVGMQPFGGARGPMIKRIYAKLIALTSARTIKETL